MQTGCKEHPTQNIEDVLDGVVNIRVRNGTDTVIRVVKAEARSQTLLVESGVNKLANGQEKLIEGQNAVVDALNVVADSADIKVGIAMDQMKKAQDKANRSERTAREVCGKLGSVERKRRQEDVENMGRLRNELGVMKRQMRDKDRMVETLSNRVEALSEQVEAISDRVEVLSDRVEAVLDHFEDVHHEMSDMAGRQVASNTKLDAMSDLLVQLVNRRS